MGIGIIVCGLNGSGKSTLGRALAEKLGFHFIDSEKLFFPETDTEYAAPRPRKEAVKILEDEIKAHENFVFASVIGDYGEEILSRYSCAVLVNVPKEIRLQRIKNRSFQKFGSRMLEGGELYEREKAFLDMASSRPEDYSLKWTSTLHCPVIHVDGTKNIEDNAALLSEQILRL